MPLAGQVSAFLFAWEHWGWGGLPGGEVLPVSTRRAPIPALCRFCAWTWPARAVYPWSMPKCTTACPGRASPIRPRFP